MKSEVFKVLTASILLLHLVACGGGVTGDENNYIVVEDQILVDLNKVKISEAKLQDPAWVVVYESFVGPQQIQGKVLGTKLLESGSHQNVFLTLERDIVNNEELYAELRKDSGEIGKFEPSGADSIVSQAGINSVPFQVFISDEPYLRISDGELHNQRLIIEKIVTNRPSWVVVYKFDNVAENNTGMQLNAIRLSAGHRSNVEVSMPDFDESLTLKDGDKIIVGLYENASDLGEDDVFEPSTDIQLESQGQPVSVRQEISINSQ